MLGLGGDPNQEVQIPQTDDSAESHSSSFLVFSSSTPTATPSTYPLSQNEMDF